MAESSQDEESLSEALSGVNINVSMSDEIASHGSESASTADMSSFDHILPDDWELNILLMKLSDEITPNELEKLKTLCSGEGGTARGVLENITDPLKFFSHLRTREMINRNNILCLQSMIWHLGRTDLFHMFQDYARSVGNKFYLCTPNITPEIGMTHFKIHVRGSVNGFNRNYLENIRSYVAKLLFIPPETVFVAGIEPSGSLIITFRVPNICREGLLSLTDEDRAGFAAFNIDIIYFEDETITINDDIVNQETDQEQTEIARMFHKMKSYEKELENNQLKIMEYEAHIKDLETRLLDLDHGSPVEFNSLLMLAADLYRSIQIKSHLEAPMIESLSKKSALVYFRHTMKKVREKGYDVDIIQNLIEANTSVVRGSINSAYKHRIEIMQSVINDLQTKLTFTQYEKEKLAFYLRLDLKDPILSAREEFFLKNLLKGTQIKIGVEVGTSFTEEFKDLLRNLSKALKKREKYKLQNGTPVPLTEDEKKILLESSNMLLEVLMSKALINTGGKIDIAQYLVNVLASVNRLDLIRKFEQFSQMPKQPQQHADKKTRSGSLKGKSKQRHSSGDLSAGSSKSAADIGGDDSMKLNELTEEVKQMKTMMQEVLKRQEQELTKEAFFPAMKGTNWFSKPNLKPLDPYSECF